MSIARLLFAVNAIITAMVAVSFGSYARAAVVLALFLDLNAIASIGSAVALIVFTLVTFGHLRIRHETGAKAWLLVLAELTTAAVLVAFAVTTLVNEPATAVALVAILLLGVVLDLVWMSRRHGVPPVSTAPT